MSSLVDINDPSETMNATLILFAKAFQLTVPTNNNQRTSSNPHNCQIAQSVMNMSRDRQIHNVRGNGIANQSGTGNIVAARAEDGSAEVQLNDKCYDNEIFNMFTQEEQYTDLLEPISEPQLVPQNDNHVTFVSPSMVQSGGTVETSSSPNEETHQKMALGYLNPSYLKKAQLKQQSLYNGNLLLEEHDPPPVYDLEETLELAQESREKNEILKKEIKPANYAKINHLSGIFVPQTTKSKEELFLSNVSNMVIVSKMISILNEDLSDDTTPSVARKFLNEVERLQAQLRDLKGKSSDTPSTSNTLDPLNQKLESKIVELELQVVNYEREISHLKTTYKNMFDTITSNRAHAKLHNLIYENAKLRARLFKNTSKSMNNTSGTSVTPYVDKPKLIAVTPHSKKLHASIPVDLVPNNQSSASIRTNPITNFQRHVTFKENVSSDTVNASSTRLVHTARTRRPQPNGNSRNARVPSASKNSEVKKNVTIQDHRRILLLYKNQKTMSSECNNIKLAIRNDKSEIACETMNVTFDELLAMDFEQNSSKPGLQSLTSGQISSELELTYAPSTITPQRLSERDLDILFE
nr:hypothetical protein [Tanacetum cinerariifolium]